MPLRNRVTPLGELIADPARGTVFGNRGRLHDEPGEIRRHHRGMMWIACRLDFNGRHRDPMPPGEYTGLFFLDDATALAAGHRPCGECRRRDHRAFAERWPRPLPDRDRARAINAHQHEERLTPEGEHRMHEDGLDALPDGTFVLRDGEPWLVHGDALRRWTPGGYAEGVARPEGTTATVITPRSTVEVLRRGWRPEAVPFLHPSAG